MNEMQNIQYYYELNGQRIGPVTYEEIQNLINHKKITRETLVFHNRMTQWTNAKNLDFDFQLADPPPLIGQFVKNTYLWLLAFTPLLGILLYNFLIYNFFVKDLTYYRFAQFEDKINSIGVGVVFFLNVIFSILDEISLENAGHNTEKFKGWTWFVPVYIYVRIQNTKINYACFVCWIVAFILSFFTNIRWFVEMVN